MIVRGLDENGDILTNGIMFVRDRECVRQTIVTRLKLFLGEYFRDINDGVPWFQSILGKFENIAAVESILRTRIANTDGVVRLLSFNLDYDGVTRALTVSGSVLTQFGAQEFEVSNG
jgi:hypothetical protein